MKHAGFPQWVGRWLGETSIRKPRHGTVSVPYSAIVESQLLPDVQTLRQLIAGLEQLQERVSHTSIVHTAEQRGYLTPEEDDRVRRALLAYRNYRLALYDIIFRLEHYPQLRPAGLRLKAFLVAFVAALALYAKSLQLDELASKSTLVRAKLNEPEPKFGLEAGFFDEVMLGYASLRNYGSILRALWFWTTRRRALHALARLEPEPWGWLEERAVKGRRAAQSALNRVLRNRLEQGWRAFWKSAFRPVSRLQYGMRARVGGRFAGSWLHPSLHQALDEPTLEKLQRLLQPGDVLLMRSEGKLTAALLPGFWAHAAIYLGTRGLPTALEGGGSEPYPPEPYERQSSGEGGKLGTLGSDADRLTDNEARFGCIIESVSPRVRIVSLKTCLDADHVLVFRPELPSTAILEALLEARRHLGKEYDFEFDFNLSSRLVCTGLVYRTYHGRGGIEFRLVKRLGNFTLTGDDVVAQALTMRSMERACFRPVALALRRKMGWRLDTEPQRIQTLLGRIQRGWRPIHS